MKTHIVLIMVFSGILAGYAQHSESGSKKYSIGNYGIELSLGPLWSYNMISLNHHEFLYKCTGSLNCANIQFRVSQLEPGMVLSDVINDVIEKFRSEDPEIALHKSELIINGISYSILDSRHRQENVGTGQTLVLAKTNFELLTIVYTGIPERMENWQKNYRVERERFFNILNSLMIPDKAPQRTLLASTWTPRLKLLNCNDSVAYLVDQRDTLRYCLELHGQPVKSEDGHFLHFRNNALVTYVDEKEAFMKMGNGSVDNREPILSYINKRAGIEQMSNPKGKNKYFYINTFKVDLAWGRKGVIWRLVDYDGHKMREIQESRNVYVSLDVGDYFYTIKLIQMGDQSFDEQKALLSKLVNSLKYGGKGALDSTKLCMRQTGNY